jgi:hypothetical protein
MFYSFGGGYVTAAVQLGSSMGDIKNPYLLYAKGGLMLAVGLLASLLLLVRSPGLATVALLGVAIWGFGRAYYFAFYVIEHYADPSYKFAGLFSFFQYLVRNRKRRPPEPVASDGQDEAVDTADSQ